MRNFAIALAAATLVLGAGAGAVSAGEYEITVDRVGIDTGDFTRTGVGFNGASPGPVLRFREGEDVTIRVTNNLTESTSIHWHGLILPYQQDGVPGISYPGIPAGETFTYRFPIVQSGTYWFHSHTGFQEPDGAYGAIVIEPKEPEPYVWDREYVVQLADAHPHSGDRIMRNLKMMPDYYNRKQRTLFDFLGDAEDKGFGAALSDRKAWGDMRMMPTDIEDLQGFTPLINGKGPAQNWTGLFEPGERVRLRFINSSAMTYFDIRIPGLEMTVVQADGNEVQPVAVDEFRIAVAETFDVIVEPKDDRAYTIFAESMGRTAYGRGTLAPREGMAAEVPALRDAPLLTMADMGMAHGEHGEMDHAAMGHDAPKPETMDHSKMDHAAMGHGETEPLRGPDPFYAPGSGLAPEAADGGRFLSYADLKARTPLYPHRPATREIELKLTGNMERYMWSINGVKYADAEPIRLQYGERVRFRFVNTTMMTHPMHLHGMWSILDNGSGEWNPVKHVISVAPGTTVYMETEVDAPGQWAFHCHLSYHADAGMFRKVIVEGGPQDKAAELDARERG
ncbi:MAG: copper oxidase [Rhizobiales bacterium NRL2]|nr:MAG: copper oxidase [Rhizobiales bacterium NRL2]